MLFKLKNKINLLPVLLFILLTNLFVCNCRGDGVFITELALSEQNGQDWIELYFTENFDTSEIALYYGDWNMDKFWRSPVCVMPKISIKKGEYLVIHFNSGDYSQSESDDTGDINNNGYWDVYSSSCPRQSGFYSTDGAVRIASTIDYKWFDFVIYSNRDGTFSDKLKGYYDTAVDSGCWSPQAQDNHEHLCASTEGLEENYSIQRKLNLTGEPEDTNRYDDWFCQVSSPGEGYELYESSGKTLEIRCSPFFPHRDIAGEPASGKIIYNLESCDYTVDLIVFNITGYPRKHLLRDHKLTASEGIFLWNGYDDYGEIVPVGVYIVFLKAVNRTTGRVKKEQKIITVGRNF